MHVLAVTHGPSVGAGVFAEAIEAAGHELDEWCVPVSSTAPRREADAVMVFGGGMHADQEELHGWLVPELEFVASVLERGTPLLGVCLGAQLLARAGGGSAFPAPEPEIGWHDVTLTEAGRTDPVLSVLPERVEAFQWHHYTYEAPGAVELATSPACTQAYRLGETAWGVQFHPEVTAGQIERWLGEDPKDVPDPEALRAATRERIGAWNELGRRLCAAFLEAAHAT
jgi:GMP synthase-like glutamine amidotransferase